MSKILVKIDGMSCYHCKMNVEKTLSQLDGISWFAVDLQKGQVEIAGNPQVDLIITAIENLGYQAKIITSSSTAT